jgi:hypothetical protein
MKFFTNFKNIALMLCITLFCGLGYAQDIIITKNARKIEVKVLEINNSDVKYKNFDNQDGPIYTILKSAISSILYANGTVEIFPETQTTNSASNYNSSSNSTNNSTNNVANNGANNSVNDGTPIAVSRFNQMSDRQQEAFLQQTDLEIYQKFHSGSSLRNSGKSLLGAGLGLTGGGLGLMILGVAVTSESLVSIGAIFFSVGETFIIVSIPLSAIGGVKKKSAQNDYRNKYSDIGAFEPSLNLNFHSNGIGLAINF